MHKAAPPPYRRHAMYAQRLNNPPPPLRTTFPLNNRRRPKQRENTKQSALEMIFYGAFTVFGIMVVPGQEWFWPSKHWWGTVQVEST